MNKHHPEQKDSQIYMGNVCIREAQNPFSKSIGWNTVCYGEKAYDLNGNIIKDMVPCFVEKREIQAAIESQKYRIKLYGDPPGCKDNVTVWQKMLDSATVFYERE